MNFGEKEGKLLMIIAKEKYRKEMMINAGIRKK